MVRRYFIVTSSNGADYIPRRTAGPGKMGLLRYTHETEVRVIRLRPWRVLAIGILGTATSLAAQQATPTFRAAVDLVTVDVRVLDKAGRPVPGLTADDFIVTLDGKPSPVRVIDYLSFPTRNVVNMPAPPTPTTGTAVRAGRSIIFGIDDRSIRVDDMPPFTEVISR